MRRPCAYASLPSKTAETYASARAAVLANIGQEPAGEDRLVAIEFNGAFIGAAPADFPSMQLSGCYFHPGRPVPSAVRINSAYRACTLKTRSSNKSAETPQSRMLRVGSTTSTHYRMKPSRRSALI